jgi:hypothetical protein
MPESKEPKKLTEARGQTIGSPARASGCSTSAGRTYGLTPFRITCRMKLGSKVCILMRPSLGSTTP